jgi:PadR family transcriptional regulator PadR
VHDIGEEARAWRSQLRKGTLELAVLALLRQESRYGLQLVQDLNALGFGVAEGSIYPLLSRLRVEKKVETEWVDSGVGHARKYYRLTRRGDETRAAMVAAWSEFRRAIERATGGEQ